MARSLAGGTGEGERFRLGECAGLAQGRRSEEEWRPREGIVFLLRRAAGGEEKRGCEAGSAATSIMRCRS